MKAGLIEAKYFIAIFDLMSPNGIRYGEQFFRAQKRPLSP
jgi:hypothetical protein